MFSNKKMVNLLRFFNHMFPSPLGVICSLIFKEKNKYLIHQLEFPSPFGVICSLIFTVEPRKTKIITGFRLLSELYVL